MSTYLETFTPPVLIVGFRRFQNLKNILHICVQAGVTRIYVAIDGPRSDADEEDILACKSALVEFEKTFNGILSTRFATVNGGAAYSVLSGCDWVFESEEFAIILEDDCLPSLDFFTYVSDARKHLSLDSNVYLIGGSQFVPREYTSDTWHLSDYPSIRGWATSRRKWGVLRQELRTFNFRKSRFIKSPEFTYWEAGATRAFLGFVDAWDTPLVHILKLNKWKTILPGRNLVSNVGNDFAATHTLTSSPWLGMEVQPYLPSTERPEINERVNKWLRQNFYQISFRHFFTTRGTRLLDKLSINKRKRSPLLDRWI